jgi:hypothetical protein
MARSLVPACAVAAVLACGLPLARADNAAADLLPGDRLHGNILTPDDFDALSLYLPAGSIVNIDLLAEKGSAILPGLQVLDPSDATLDLSAWSLPGPGGVGTKVRRAPVGAEGGAFRILASATGGTSGKYAFRLTAKMPKKAATVLDLPAMTGGELSFDAPAGTKMSWSVKGPAGTDPAEFPVSLRDPADAVVALPGPSGRKHALGQDGTWTLLVDNNSNSARAFQASVTLALPKASKRVLYLSPSGFGPAPVVRTVDPSKVLDDRTATGVSVLGTGFDPAASVRLEKKGQEPIAASNLAIGGEGSLTADFDVTGVSTGAWNLVVENPSGGAGRRRLTVQGAGSVKLPDGLQPGTEVWWIDFDHPAFRNDLAAMGLGSGNADVAALAEAGVKSYALYWLRKSFGNDPLTGKVLAGGVPVSFCLKPPPSTVGAVVETYNRIVVGGAAAMGDPSSNPNYPWGDGPVDAANAAFDDLGPAGGTGRGVKTAVLVPNQPTNNAAYFNALKPLLDLPLTGSDLPLFFPNFVPSTETEGTRYRDLAEGTNAAGKEIAGMIAHFVARAMGTADGATGLSAVPAQVGDYSALGTFGFSAPERTAMAAAARPGIPGKAKTLRANYFPYRETLPFLLPACLTGQNYAVTFRIGGGRPDRLSADLDFKGVAGFLPLGVNLLATGGLSGTAPLRAGDGTLVGGVFLFRARLKDAVSGESIDFIHRLNVLVDTANPLLTPAEVALGTQKNAQTINTP